MPLPLQLQPCSALFSYPLLISSHPLLSFTHSLFPLFYFLSPPLLHTTVLSVPTPPAVSSATHLSNSTRLKHVITAAGLRVFSFVRPFMLSNMHTVSCAHVHAGFSMTFIHDLPVLQDLWLHISAIFIHANTHVGPVHMSTLLSKESTHLTGCW